MSDPHAEGREAFDCGKDDSANPYDPETQEAEHFQWNDGWRDACDDACDIGVDGLVTSITKTVI